MKAPKIGNLKRLPDEEKAKIAHILLNGERSEVRSREPLQLPMLKLLKHSTAGNLAVEFLRVSSDDQSDGFSLPAQKEKAKEYISQHRLKCVNTWSVTESASKEMDRKEFFDMIHYVSENGIKNVVFDKIDRACRGLRAAVLIEDLVEAGVRFHFTRDGLIVDKDSPPGDKLRFYLGVVLAKYYIDNLKTEIRKGLDQRWEHGYSNGLAPVGYRNLRDDTGRAWVEVNKKIAPFIQQIFELYSTGNYSYKALEAHLAGKVSIEKETRVEKNGELICSLESYPITHKCIENLICNPFYYGARRQKGKVTFTGNEKHTPLISKDLFDACLKIKAIRAKKCHISLAHEIRKPFMNLIKCAVCNHAVTGEIHKKASGKIYIYYHCANQTCLQRRINVRQEMITTQLAKAFEPFSRLTPKATSAFIAGLKDQIEGITQYASEQLQKLQEKKKLNEDRFEELRLMVAEGTLTVTEYDELISVKRKQLPEIELQIEAHANASQQIFVTALKVIELLGKSSEFMALDGNELNKARLVRLILSNLTLRDGKLEYHYEKVFDDLIELTRHRNWWR